MLIACRAIALVRCSAVGVARSGDSETPINSGVEGSCMEVRISFRSCVHPVNEERPSIEMNPVRIKAQLQSATATAVTHASHWSPIKGGHQQQRPRHT